jgi:fatty-acyl-CoA synthase
MTNTSADRATSYWAATADTNQDGTVGEMLRSLAGDLPERPALVFVEPGGTARSWTYGSLLGTATEVARALLTRFRPGERVAIWAPNCAEWVLLQHGCALAGIVLVTLNPAYLASEVEYALRQARVAGVFYAESYRDVHMSKIVDDVSPLLPELREQIALDEWAPFLSSADPSVALPDVEPGDVAQIQYTSGTTGNPKGVLLHHRGIVGSARRVADRAGIGDGWVSVNAMPLFHIGGCGTMELGTFSKRGTFVLAPGFDAAHILELVGNYRADIILAVPTMLIALLDHPDRGRRDLSCLKTVMSGGAAVPAELVRRVRKTFDCRFTITYGQTETCGPIIQTSLDDGEREQAETVGRALPGAEVRIVDPVTMEAVPHGEQGEICTRGEQTMRGYFDRPEDTAEAINHEQWLRSGDLGSMDALGFISITGRIKDMIIRGGEKIYPREVEDVLFSHPGIRDAAVVGIPDDQWGERVAAVIMPTDMDAPPSEQELTEFSRTRLARYKTPREWFFVEEYPKTPSGKIQKYILRDRITRGLDLPGALP